MNAASSAGWERCGAWAPGLAVTTVSSRSASQDPASPKNERKTSTFPRQLTLLEMSGALVGPVAYLRSRRWARTAGRAARRASGRAS